MKYLKAIFQFCSFLFVPQWGRIRKTNTDLIGPAERKERAEIEMAKLHRMRGKVQKWRDRG